MFYYRCRPYLAVAVLLVAGAFAPVAAQTVADPAAIFFDDTVVHDVRLTINSRDWQALQEHYLENDYYVCDFRWRDHVLRNIGIRSRGTGSRSAAKPGLRVDFDRYVTDGKFLELKSFILRNNTQDPSNMHERLSMLFFRRMGVPASREAHARLFINNEYSGMYTIVESVDKAFLKKTFDENDGWLYKYDYNVDDQPYYLDYRGSDPNLYVPRPFKAETRENDPQPEFFERMIRTINEASDAVFRTAVAEFLDLGKFIRHIAVEAYLADNDGFNGNWGMNNFYLYRFENQSLFTFIPWDKSNTFMDGPEYPIWHNIYDVPESIRNRLTIRALADGELRNLFLDTLLEAASSASATSDSETPAPEGTPGWLDREIARGYEQIRDGVLADPSKPYTNEQFEAEIENLKRFARERGDFVRSEVARARGQ